MPVWQARYGMPQLPSPKFTEQGMATSSSLHFQGLLLTLSGGRELRPAGQRMCLYHRDCNLYESGVSISPTR